MTQISEGPAEHDEQEGTIVLLSNSVARVTCELARTQSAHHGALLTLEACRQQVAGLQERAEVAERERDEALTALQELRTTQAGGAPA